MTVGTDTFFINLVPEQTTSHVTLQSALTNRGTLKAGGLEVAERTPRMDTADQSGTKEKKTRKRLNAYGVMI